MSEPLRSPRGFAKRILRSSPPVIILMGPPGSGKGTQARSLRERYGFETIETGAIFRRLSAEASPAGRQLKALLDAGRLASPPFAARLVIGEAQRMLKRGKGIVFDGSPRTLREAELLLEALVRKRKPRRFVGGTRVPRLLVIALDVSEQETVKRIVNRWVCEGCERPSPDSGASLNACAACGGKIVRRADDTALVAKRRWEEYAFRTLPVIRYFERLGCVVRVDGNRPPSSVSAETGARVAEFFGLQH